MCSRMLAGIDTRAAGGLEGARDWRTQALSLNGNEVTHRASGVDVSIPRST